MQNENAPYFVDFCIHRHKIAESRFKRVTRRNNWLRGLHNEVYIIYVHNKQIFTKTRKSVEIQGFLRYSNSHSGKKIGRNNIFRINCDCFFLPPQYVVFLPASCEEEDTDGESGFCL